MADDITVDIQFKGNANAFLAELSRAVGRAKTQLQEMGQSNAALSRLETQLAKMSQTTNKVAGATKNAASATEGWSQKWTPFKGQFQQAEANSKSLWASIDSGISQSEKSLGRASATLAKFDEQQRNTAQQRAAGNPMADWDKQFAAASKAADENTAAMKRAKAAVEEYSNTLSNTRYVLYDVAGTLSILGIALITPIAGIIKQSADMQLAFAQVARTSGVAGAQLQKLKEDFDALYASIPITYEALAQIATLAGQLGVPSGDIAKFTETVAKTATVTNLSVDQAATAFGRLNALIPNVKGQYDKLASSIVKVGVNSVATESEIVNISTQISAMGSFAGLTAQDIVGLSGALASIGVQPELARGTITRVFTLMSRAVASGGNRLKEFASLSGVSAEKFAQSWGKPEFKDVFLGFVAGIRNEGPKAVKALNELGITSVRDIPLLLRLANAADSTGQAGKLLAQTIGDANSGWSQNVELQRQYAIVADTVAKRAEVLANNFNLILQAIGAPMLSGLAEFLSFMTNIAKAVTDFAKTDLGGNILGVVVALTALTGVLALGAGAMALMGASTIGVYQALQFLSVQSPIAAKALLGTAGAAALANGELKASATSALLFSRALKAISVVGAILLLPGLFEELGNAMDKLQGITRSDKTAVPNFVKAIQSAVDPADKAAGSVKALRMEMLRLGTTDSGRRALIGINEAFKTLADAGDRQGIRDMIETIAKGLGTTADAVATAIPGAKNALDGMGLTFGELAASTQVTAQGADVLGGSLQGVEADAQAAQDALDEYKKALDNINGTQISASEASDRLQEAINKATDAAKEQGTTLTGTNAASIGFRDSLRDIETKARDAGKAILDNGGTVEQAQAKWQAGRDQVVKLLEQMGLAPGKARAWADAQLGSASQIEDAFGAIKAGLDQIPGSKYITVTANTKQAESAINQFIRDQNAKYIKIGVYTYRKDGNGDVSVQYGSNQNHVARAGGGSVFGPGTSTSDSIHALLSDGEYVLRTKAARAIGYGKLDYMNRFGKLPAFAGGGQVGSSYPSSMMVELSPADRMNMWGSGGGGTPVIVMIDGKQIAAVVRSQNAKDQRRGRGQ